MRVVICGGPYTDNIGDALIHECLKATLARVLPEAELESLDIGGRRAAGDVPVRSKGLALRMIKGLPAPLRRSALFAPLLSTIRRRVLPVWKELLRPRDVLVIGGGQLLQDPDLNFPLKLVHLARLSDRLEGRRSIYAVGVGREWSWLGTRCFRELIATDSLCYLSVRDERSRESLLRHLPELGEDDVRIDLDPALLVDEVYRPEGGTQAKDIDVGVCPASPDILGLGAHALSSDEVLRRWVGLVQGLSAKGRTVGLFTNGSAEDEEFLARLAARCEHFDRVMVLPRALRGAQYVENLARMKSVVAHRLHAAIACYALNIPSFGLEWDEKLVAFFDLTGRPECTANFASVDLSELVETVAGLAETTIEAGRRRDVIDAAREGVTRLGQSLIGREH